jgi:hypothetical protein
VASLGLGGLRLSASSFLSSVDACFNSVRYEEKKQHDDAPKPLTEDFEQFFAQEIAARKSKHSKRRNG